jgi:methyl-accepting chemotaxis protein
MRDSEKEIDTVSREFEDLARHTDAILNLAAGVIGCVEDDSVKSILPKVQSLGAEARKFIQERLRATAGILETVIAEAELLGRLSRLTRGQRAIARETQALSVLTNIEVAHLGQLGTGFQYLAHQLGDFSQSVTEGAKDLACHTDERRASIEETKRMLMVELPRMHQEFARIEVDLENALAAAGSSLAELSRTPAQFRGCVEEIAGQIAGVVAAIQAHDITRQQVEHVREALQLISAKIRGVDNCKSEASNELPRISAGLVIQAYQLKSIRETMGDWVSQIRRCMDGILRISSSEVVGTGPVVLEQERELSQQLARIEALEQECRADTAEVDDTLAGLSNLMQLVSEHLEKSKSVRDRLQLLSFNSIVESSRLGTQADAILEISQSIKRISVAWSEITDQSAQAKGEILNLAEQARQGLDVFSQDATGALRAAQAETGAGLENLRTAAGFAAGQAMEIESSIGRLQVKIAAVGITGNRLDACLGHIDTVLQKIEELKRQFVSDYPDALDRSDQAEVEAMFSASYTTEIERDVLHAALCGAPLPVVQQNLAGNDVELF